MISLNNIQIIVSLLAFPTLLIYLTLQGYSHAQELTLEKQAKKMIVMIEGGIPNRDGKEVSGAGIIVGFGIDDQDWPTKVYIATAKHVVVENGLPKSKEAENIKVFFKLIDEEEEFSAEIVKVHKELDLALLEVTELSAFFADALTVLSFNKVRNANSLKCVGEVRIIGYPQGVKWHTPQLPDRFSSVSEKEIYFESRAILVGSSGGGLFDEQWNLVGMVTEDSPPRAKALRISTLIKNIEDWGYPTKLILKSREDYSLRISQYTKRPDICVGKGDNITINARGLVSIGTHKAYTSSEGKITELIPISVQRNIIEEKENNLFSHAALMYRIAQKGESIICDGLSLAPHEECEWYSYTPNTTLIANKDGYLEFNVNDKEPEDNTGFFQVNLIVTREIR